MQHDEGHVSGAAEKVLAGEYTGLSFRETTPRMIGQRCNRHSNINVINVSGTTCFHFFSLNFSVVAIRMTPVFIVVRLAYRTTMKLLMTLLLTSKHSSILLQRSRKRLKSDAISVSSMDISIDSDMGKKKKRRRITEVASSIFSSSVAASKLGNTLHRSFTIQPHSSDLSIVEDEADTRTLRKK